MENNDYSRLCGGTFFALLLQATQQRSKVRDRYGSGSDGLNGTSVLIGLIRVANPDYKGPAPSTFSQNASSYKSCKISDSVYLPFKDKAFVSAFDCRIKNDYKNVLAAMWKFVNQFIDTGSTGKHIHLVKALLELVEQDTSIADTDLFYANYDGNPIRKADLCGMNDICLPAFLLGIWHFIVQNRRDNTIGRATFKSWHKKPDVTGQSWMYIGRMGEKLAHEITVHVPLIGSSENEPFTEYREPYAEQPAPEFSTDGTDQTINQPIVFSQQGNNNIQIGSIGTLTINNG